MGLMLLALAWGFAEATLFFIVPDVLLTLVATARPREAIRACLWCAAGALAGGALMFAWGAHHPEVARATVERVPAVSEAMLDRVADALSEHGAAALFAGPPRGVPYKTFAVQAHAAGLGAAAFLAVSVPARLLRFLVLTALAAWAARRMPAGWSPWRRRMPVLAVWIVFYAWYFAVMPN